MTIETWLQGAAAEAHLRGLSELQPLLRALAQATRALREADFNDSPLAEQKAAPRL